MSLLAMDTSSLFDPFEFPPDMDMEPPKPETNFREKLEIRTKRHHDHHVKVLCSTILFWSGFVIIVTRRRLDKSLTLVFRTMDVGAHLYIIALSAMSLLTTMCSFLISLDESRMWLMLFRSPLDFTMMKSSFY